MYSFVILSLKLTGITWTTKSSIYSEELIYLLHRGSKGREEATSTQSGTETMKAATKLPEDVHTNDAIKQACLDFHVKQ